MNAFNLAKAVGLPLVVFTFSVPPNASADVTLASPFQDHMVLQQEMPVPVWGIAAPGEKVTVTFAAQTKTAIAGENGKWTLKLDPLTANNTSADMTVAGSNHLMVKDVLVGEVWFASGQSNMSYWFDPKVFPDDVAKGDRPTLREFNAKQYGSLTVEDQSAGEWSVCSRETLTHNCFSGVAFFFARDLQEKLKVPIGIVHSSFGGSPAEAWVSREAMSTVPAFKQIAETQTAAMAARPEEERTLTERVAAWQAANGSVDTGNEGVARGWADHGTVLTGWTDVKLPGGFTQFGLKTGGIVWLRKDFDIPDGAAGKPFDIRFGGTEDSIDTYWNGTRIADPKPFFYRELAIKIPAELVKAGPTTVAFRIHSSSVNGRLWRTTQQLGLPVASNDSSEDMWKCQIEKSFPPLSEEARRTLPKAPQAVIQYTATCLFNSQVNPFIPYAMRGAIWYQGESNSGRAQSYKLLMNTLMKDWRDRWNEGDFPFYIVQLANYGAPAAQPNEEGWAAIREVQAQIATDDPHSGLAVAIDIGDAKTIHPANKQGVGSRLALNALAKTYRQAVEYSGPVYQSMTVDANKVVLKFTHADGGLVAKGGPLKQFIIAGGDGKYVWANAVIDGSTVIVTSPSIEKPCDVRYAWATNPEGCNLYNAAGLPAVPFRTDAPVEDKRNIPLKNPSFSDPSVAPARYKYSVRPAGWDFQGSDSGLSMRDDAPRGANDLLECAAWFGKTGSPADRFYA